jgi:Dyp-type peroxidase family
VWCAAEGHVVAEDRHLFPVLHDRGQCTVSGRRLDGVVKLNVGKLGAADYRSWADEVHGFRYFDDISSVLSTERRTRRVKRRSTPHSWTLEDAAFAGGSYVIVQKYLHDLAGWDALSTEGRNRVPEPHRACPAESYAREFGHISQRRHQSSRQVGSPRTHPPATKAR